MTVKLENILRQLDEVSFEDLLTLQEQILLQMRQRTASSIVELNKKREWPEGLLERTAGSFKDEPLVREYEGDYEEREALL